MENNINAEKKALLDEIVSLREELKEKNDMINDLGSSVSFINLFIIPLLVAALVIFIVMRLSSITSNQSVGFFIITFVISLSISTYINKKNISERKKQLIDERLALQKLLVSKGKELSELEKNNCKISWT